MQLVSLQSSQTVIERDGKLAGEGSLMDKLGRCFEHLLCICVSRKDYCLLLGGTGLGRNSPFHLRLGMIQYVTGELYFDFLWFKIARGGWVDPTTVIPTCPHSKLCNGVVTYRGGRFPM